MLSRFFYRLKYRRNLTKNGGDLVDTSYLLYLNNLDPISFPSRDNVMEYLKRFRSDNEIFKLQLFRIETYSL